MGFLPLKAYVGCSRRKGASMDDRPCAAVRGSCSRITHRADREATEYSRAIASQTPLQNSLAQTTEICGARPVDRLTKLLAVRKAP